MFRAVNDYREPRLKSRDFAQPTDTHACKKKRHDHPQEKECIRSDQSEEDGLLISDDVAIDGSAPEETGISHCYAVRIVLIKLLHGIRW